jgi:hypothetical protein
VEKKKRNKLLHKNLTKKKIAPQKKKKKWMTIMGSLISMHVRQFSSPKSGSCRTACTDHTGIFA